MSNRYENIFFNLIRNETSLTEALCNLMKYKSFRNHFIDFVQEKNSNFIINKNSISFDNFDTEKDFGFKEEEEDKKVGRGDLILEYDGKDYIFELKIEITTDFTENQPDGYIQYLEKQNQTKKDLYFILPKNYTKLLKLEDKINSENILYWEDFILSLKENGLTDIQYVKDFCEILDYRWFYSEEFSFNKYEIDLIKSKRNIEMSNTSIPIIIMDLFKKVDIIQEQITQKTKSYKDRVQYGFCLKNKEKKDILWFGVDYEFWEKTTIPLTIAISKEDIVYLEAFKKHFKEKIKKFEYEDKHIYYHLPIEIIDNLSTDDIKSKINEVKDAIGLE